MASFGKGGGEGREGGLAAAALGVTVAAATASTMLVRLAWRWS